MGELDQLGGVEGGQKPQKVVDSGEHTMIRPKGVGDECDVKTNTPSQDMLPGDSEGDQIESRAAMSARAKAKATGWMGYNAGRTVQ